ncbi:hypothetical protein ACIGMX_34855 [Streptomyces aquilus]|uniref:zinc finger domain-containing protein n=1 Tax=Streptomyces aquilus TaxID=2548456 RepID=UPI0037D2155F
MTDHPEHAIRCPWCHAAPGQRCASAIRGRRLTIASHDARITAWTNHLAAKTDQEGHNE